MLKYVKGCQQKKKAATNMNVVLAALRLLAYALASSLDESELLTRLRPMSLRLRAIQYIMILNTQVVTNGKTKFRKLLKICITGVGIKNSSMQLEYKAQLSKHLLFSTTEFLLSIIPYFYKYFIIIINIIIIIVLLLLLLIQTNTEYNYCRYCSYNF